MMKKEERRNLKVYQKVFGCQMNEYDSDEVKKSLCEKGYEITEEASESDIILFNTCSVRQHAEERVFGNLRKLSKLKKKRPEVIIGIMGCMVNAYKEELLKDFPHVDFISGTYDFGQVPEILDEVLKEREQKAFISLHYKGFRFSRYTGRFNKIKAFVPVMRGCDNFCSFCIVPYVRGREISRNPDEIIDEISFLAEHGVKEIMLLGQNVNSYGKGLHVNIDFPDLLSRVNDVNGIEVIRFMTSHPKDTSEKLFSVMKDNEKVEKHLHLPLQSGSDKILRAMNRNYSINDYSKKIDSLRKLIPSVSITTDIIVGFCGEGDSEYNQTKDVIKGIRFDDAFIFKYSPRKGTKAFTLKDDVSQRVKNERNNDLLKLQKSISYEKNKELIGREEKVLVEAVSRKNNTQMKGRTSSDKEVVFEGTKDMIGKIFLVKLTDIVHETFIGKLCNNENK